MIKLLDKNTIDKIAAGEVIERPSSVVKELLENSIDAGSGAITVEIKDGGISYIRITDNGVGIPKEEVKTAYLRHATSKIDSASDLDYITSLGFRGEALSTIAAVSQTEMITKTSDSVTGVKYVIHGGEEIDFSEVGVPNGTTIIVQNLFFNTPARKKFLKSPMTEASYIQDLVLRIALSHPELSFKLIVNNQTKIDTTGNGNIKDTIYQLFGRDITKNLIEISYKDEYVSINGFIGKPFLSRGNRGFENYFVNNRFIKCNIINRAIEEAYKASVMQHKFPFTVLYLTLPVEKCDVNVHPAKMEFKYSNEKELFELVSKTLRKAIIDSELIPDSSYNTRPSDVLSKQNPYNPDTSMGKPEPFETRRIAPSIKNVSSAYSNNYSALSKLVTNDEDNDFILNQLNDDGVKYQPNITKTRESISISENSNSNPISHIDVRVSGTPDTTPEIVYSEQGEQISMFDKKFLSDEARKNHRIIGQLFKTFWLIESDGKLYIMDQHAAHEKINYEKYMKSIEKKEVYSQQLMPPMVVTLSYNERQALLDNYDFFMQIGYDIEEFGGCEFKINAVPSNVFDVHSRSLFMELLSSLVNNSGYMTKNVFHSKVASLACHAAIKGNTIISQSEAQELINELMTLDTPYTCPHGRPTIISMTREEMEKKFKRIV